MERLRRHWTAGRLAGLGMLGSVTCSAAMLAAILGIGGTAAAGGGAMTDMTGMPDVDATAAGPVDALIGFLTWAGPVILVPSLAAVAAATAVHRSAAVGVVLIAGAVLFWGMYLQTAPTVMLASIAVGLVVLVAAYIWATASPGLAEPWRR